MKIIVGHTNLDLDCIGSMVLARYLFPDHRPVASRLVHPVARHLYNLYADRLGFLPPEQLKGQRIERVVVVDTRVRARVEEFLQHLAGDTDIVVFDHHSEDTSDIPGAVVREKSVGANSTLLGLELLHRGLTPAPEDATIALTGIYADTGNFTHENVQHADFQVASLCLQSGASLNLVRSFLRPLQEEHQLALFHETLNRLVYRTYSGHLVVLSFLELEKQVAGLAAVAEKVFEVEGPDALFAVFSFQKENQSLIVGRSRSREINLNQILAAFGGGGHALAASALVKGRSGRQVFAELDRHLLQTLQPAATAGRIMQREFPVLMESCSLMEAALLLEKHSRTGVPVLNEARQLVGFVSLRDIMKGRRSGHMGSPVSAYMSRKAVSGKPQTTVREIEHLFFTHNIGHLPIVEEGRVIGVVTRSDYLAFVERRRKEDLEFLERLANKGRPESGA